MDNCCEDGMCKGSGMYVNQAMWSICHESITGFPIISLRGVCLEKDVRENSL